MRAPGTAMRRGHGRRGVGAVWTRRGPRWDPERGSRGPGSLGGITQKTGGWGSLAGLGAVPGPGAFGGIRLRATSACWTWGARRMLPLPPLPKSFPTPGRTRGSSPGAAGMGRGLCPRGPLGSPGDPSPPPPPAPEGTSESQKISRDPAAASAVTPARGACRHGAKLMPVFFQSQALQRLSLALTLACTRSPRFPRRALWGTNSMPFGVGRSQPSRSVGRQGHGRGGRCSWPDPDTRPRLLHLPRARAPVLPSGRPGGASPREPGAERCLVGAAEAGEGGHGGPHARALLLCLFPACRPPCPLPTLRAPRGVNACGQ